MNIAPGTFQGLAESEVELFRIHLKGIKGIGVEIGCLDGYSSAVILDASELHLTSIDPFVPDSMEPSLIGSRERYMCNIAPWNLRNTLIVGYSHQVVHHWQDNIDFLFIDGNHEYGEVMRDYNDWTPRLKQGGILAIHDARMMREGGAPFHPGPSRVAHEQVFSNPHEWEVIGEAFSLVIARKR
jgi:predicted O-methyltransferase YrrM